jgi:hypothetical protein
LGLVQQEDGHEQRTGEMVVSVLKSVTRPFRREAVSMPVEQKKTENESEQITA